MLSLVFRTCWIKNNLKRMDVGLMFHCCEGERWDEIDSVWDEPLLKHGPVVSCPATPPPSPQTINLATTIETIRPDLQNFSVLVKCIIRTQSYQKSLGPAQWQLEYPAGTSTRQPLDGESLQDDEKLVSVISLPIGGQRHATFIAYDGHRGSACCSAIREQEDDSVGESAWKARAEAEESGYFDEVMYDMDDSDMDSEKYS